MLLRILYRIFWNLVLNHELHTKFIPVSKGIATKHHSEEVYMTRYTFSLWSTCRSKIDGGGGRRRARERWKTIQCLQTAQTMAITNNENNKRKTEIQEWKWTFRVGQSNNGNGNRKMCLNARYMRIRAHWHSPSRPDGQKCFCHFERQPVPLQNGENECTKRENQHDAGQSWRTNGQNVYSTCQSLCVNSMWVRVCVVLVFVTQYIRDFVWKSPATKWWNVYTCLHYKTHTHTWSWTLHVNHDTLDDRLSLCSRDNDNDKQRQRARHCYRFGFTLTFLLLLLLWMLP